MTKSGKNYEKWENRILSRNAPAYLIVNKKIIYFLSTTWGDLSPITFGSCSGLLNQMI